jgi:hypothetical protein
MVCLGLAASGHFPYAVKYNGAWILGNLCFAILMRNEVFGRILYLVVNTLFAKVSGFFLLITIGSNLFLVDTFMVAIGLHFRPPGLLYPSRVV